MKVDRPNRCRVLTAYQTVYHDPLELQPGETVTVGRRDTQWPGFLWCTNAAGKGGWVPDSYLDIRGETGVAIRDYTARELSAEVGEELTLHFEESGWFWCANRRGQSGWIPAEYIEMILIDTD